ncbi:MAG TPA: hypothetical protein VMU97_00440 [Candidatus Dormibacteraeota bacterium]|nr:hypothetical protein [Candidatus Dormibacteraeota bacterium]HVA11571.1 hypothetical protein [Candidatus Dormibacteraeota bacterium]
MKSHEWPNIPTLIELTSEEVEELKTIVIDLPATLLALPAGQQQEYEEAQESVIKAKDAAPCNEGQNWII